MAVRGTGGSEWGLLQANEQYARHVDASVRVTSHEGDTIPLWARL